MNSCYRLLFAGMILIALATNFVSSTKCYDCSGCKFQISINGGKSGCPDMCKSAGPKADKEFMKRCSLIFFCSINNCYCSKQACSGSARIGNMPVVFLISFLSASFILKHFF